MKMKYDKLDIKAIAKVKDAVEFNKFCNHNNIDVVLGDVTNTNFNDGICNLYLPEYGINVVYNNGKLEEFNY